MHCLTQLFSSCTGLHWWNWIISHTLRIMWQTTEYMIKILLKRISSFVLGFQRGVAFFFPAGKVMKNNLWPTKLYTTTGLFIFIVAKHVYVGICLLQSEETFDSFHMFIKIKHLQHNYTNKQHIKQYCFNLHSELCTSDLIQGTRW